MRSSRFLSVFFFLKLELSFWDLREDLKQLVKLFVEATQVDVSLNQVLVRARPHVLTRNIRAWQELQSTESTKGLSGPTKTTQKEKGEDSGGGGGRTRGSGGRAAAQKEGQGKGEGKAKG